MNTILICKLSILIFSFFVSLIIIGTITIEKRYMIFIPVLTIILFYLIDYFSKDLYPPNGILFEHL